MTTLVTASSGHLGRLVVDALLRRGVAPTALVAGARTPAKVEDLAARGVRVVALDYSVPATVAAALEGVDQVLLISGSEPGARVAQHRAVIDAAASAGVKKFVYTSIVRADKGELPLSPDHWATEQAIAASGLPATILRNNWYLENYVADLQRAADTGVIAASVGGAAVAAASRADFAEAAAVVLQEDGHIGRTYELAGDEPLTYAAIAAAAGTLLGREVTYTAISRDELEAGLAAAGLDEGTVRFVAALDAGIAAGALAATDGTLSRLIGRPTTPAVDAWSAALASAQS